MAPVSTKNVAMESGRRPLPYTGWLVLQEEIEDRVGDQPEDQIVQAEYRQPAAWKRAGARGVEQRGGRPGGADDDRQQQWQAQQRDEQVTRSRARGEPGHERAGDGDAGVGKRQDRQQPRDRVAAR